MSDPYLSQVSAFGFNFPPRGWALCNGALLPINQNTALYSLLLTNFGGDGRTNFALPDLGYSSPCGDGQGQGMTSRAIGQSFGSTSVTLDQTTLPAHSHAVNALAPSRADLRIGTPTSSSGLTTVANQPVYSDGAANAAMATAAISTTGGQNGATMPHNNMQPYLAMNYCIAVQGVYPARP